MGEWFLGEIRLFAFDYAPQDGWLKCDGSLLQIRQNQALYSIIGIAFGGDGKTTFALPDLRGRVAVHPQRPINYPGVTIGWGKTLGTEVSALTTTQVPAHTHQVQVSSQPGTTSISRGALWATEASNGAIYGDFPTTSPSMMNANALESAGGSLPHQNMQPFQVLNYCIASQGIYPPRQ